MNDFSLDDSNDSIIKNQVSNALRFEAYLAPEYLSFGRTVNTLNNWVNAPSLGVHHFTTAHFFENAPQFAVDVIEQNLTLPITNGSIQLLNASALQFIGIDADDEGQSTTFNDSTLTHVGSLQLFGNAVDSNNLVNDDTNNETVNLGDGNNRIDSGDEDDRITVGDGDNIIESGAGDDEIFTGDGNNYILSGEGDNRIDVGDGNNRIITGDGENEIDAGDGDNRIDTGASDDDIDIGDGNNFIRAGDGDNEIETGDGDSIVITGSDDDEIETGDGNNHIVSGAGHDEIEVGDGNNLIQSGAGDDIIETEDGNNHIQAGSGDDEIITGDGNDIVRGGEGNDFIEGGAGNDHYLYELGDGNDIIFDYEGLDLIRFGAGLSQQDVSLSIEGNDLVINLTDGGSIRYDSWFTQSEHSLDGFNFADNHYVSLSHYLNDLVVTGSDFNDTLNYGYSSQGLTFSGGLGDDVITGTVNNDRYYYDLGDGQDRITDSGGTDLLILGEGIDVSDITITADAQSLFLHFNDGGSITLDNWLSEKTIALEGIVFADGTYWTNNTIGRNIETIGGAGNDQFNFSHVENEMRYEAGTGDDVINAGSVNDKFYFEVGDGHDTITDAGGIDELILGAGINASDITISATENDIVLHINDTDSITLRNWFDGNLIEFEAIRFADGTVWSNQRLGQLAIVQGSDSNDTLDYSNANNNLSFRGNAGNDLILGGFAQDRYYFGGQDGSNVIRDSGGTDFIYFDSDITAENVTVSALGSHLKLTTNPDNNAGNETEIIIENWFANGSADVQQIEGIVFANGTYWSNQFAENLISEVNGTFRDDTLNFQNSNRGLEFTGSFGNDIITGTQFNDTYYYDSEHGYDVITDAGGTDQLILGRDIASQDVTFIIDHNDLLVKISGAGTSFISGEVRLKDAVNSDSIDQIQFHDGTQLDVSEIIDSLQDQSTELVSDLAAQPTIERAVSRQPTHEQQWAQLMDSLEQFDDDLADDTAVAEASVPVVRPLEAYETDSELTSEPVYEAGMTTSPLATANIDHLFNMLNHALTHERASEFNDIDSGEKSSIYQTPPTVLEWESR